MKTLFPLAVSCCLSSCSPDKIDAEERAEVRFPEAREAVPERGLLLSAEEVESDPAFCRVVWKNVSKVGFTITLPNTMLDLSGKFISEVDEPIDYEPFRALGDYNFDSYFIGEIAVARDGIEYPDESIMLPYREYAPTEHGNRFTGGFPVPASDTICPLRRGVTVGLGPGDEIGVVYNLNWAIELVRKKNDGGKVRISFEYGKGKGSRGGEAWKGGRVSSNTLVF